MYVRSQINIYNVCTVLTSRIKFREALHNLRDAFNLRNFAPCLFRFVYICNFRTRELFQLFLNFTRHSHANEPLKCFPPAGVLQAVNFSIFPGAIDGGEKRWNANSRQYCLQGILHSSSR